MKTMLLAAAAAFVVVAPAAAQTVNVDGTRDAAYGAAKSTVLFVPATSLTPQGDFDLSQPYSSDVGYSIYLTSDANAVYGFLEANPSLGGGSLGSFANLYFDVNTPADGSDIGFEITNGRAFVPGVPGYSDGSAAAPLAGLTFATSANGVEFSLANSLFTGPIPGAASGVYTTTGGLITLRLSQSFGYSVVNGVPNGATRLGQVTLGGDAAGAVPEPATWGLMIAGFGLVGGAMRRRRTGVAFA